MNCCKALVGTYALDLHVLSVHGFQLWQSIRFSLPTYANLTVYCTSCGKVFLGWRDSKFVGSVSLHSAANVCIAKRSRPRFWCAYSYFSTFLFSCNTYST